MTLGGFRRRPSRAVETIDSCREVYFMGSCRRGAVQWSKKSGNLSVIAASDQLDQLARASLHQCAIATRFDVEADHGLGVRSAEVESPVGELEREAVGHVDRGGIGAEAALDAGERR